jgi:hypothetical protein
MKGIMTLKKTNQELIQQKAGKKNLNDNPIWNKTTWLFVIVMLGFLVIGSWRSLLTHSLP